MVEAVKLHPVTCEAGTQITGSSCSGHVGKENNFPNTNTDNFNYFSCFYRSTLKRNSIILGLPQDKAKLTK